MLGLRTHGDVAPVVADTAVALADLIDFDRGAYVLGLHRARGPPCVDGNSQARALTCTMTSGGKNPRPARAIAVVEPREPSLEEALAPLGDHFSATVQLLGDLVVPPSVGGQEDHLGPQDVKVRQRLASRTPLQLSRFVLTQFNVNMDSFSACHQASEGE